MKNTDLTLKLFDWDDVPTTQYIGHAAGRFSEKIQLGLLTVSTDEGIEGHAFLKSSMRNADLDAK